MSGGAVIFWVLYILLVFSGVGYSYTSRTTGDPAPNGGYVVIVRSTFTLLLVIIVGLLGYKAYPIHL